MGIKRLAWRSVEIPRLPPKPMLTKLSGGYRRTPVMQIGADIYCDSQCIIRELDRRQPTPEFFPTKDAGLARCLSRWTDGAMFDLTVKVVLGSAGDDLPSLTSLRIAAGSISVRIGRRASQTANAQLTHFVCPAEGTARVARRRNSVMAAHSCSVMSPAAIDAQIYYVVWFVRGPMGQGCRRFCRSFRRWSAGKTNVRELGHGRDDGDDAARGDRAGRRSA